MVSSKLLVYYDPKLPLYLACDASDYGIGAVISHVFRWAEHPIAYASHSLSKAERNYPQIEKEGLSIIFGVKRFHQFLYGRDFTLITDHKPLTAILGPRKGVPTLAAARLQRWALFLSAYTYTIKYRETNLHSNADALSRLPLDCFDNNECCVHDSLFSLGQVEALPLTAKQLAAATRSDPVLSRVVQYTRSGWPAQPPQDCQAYYRHRFELTVEGQCLLWGIHVIVPPKYRHHVLKQLHSDHIGIVRMKSLARSHVWWPGIDSEVETLVKSCLPCQSIRASPPRAPLNPWVWPSKPWSRIHVDFAGLYRGHTYFVIVDAFSKWVEVMDMPSITSERTIVVLRDLFARYGLPDQLVSDNGTQFTSSEFQVFMKQNGIKHIRCAPYHPATNGAAERFVQTLKKALRGGKEDGKSPQHLLSSFLLKYRSTPHSVTGETPSMLFLGRQVKTLLDLLKPCVEVKVRNRQADQKKSHDGHCRAREFEVGDLVMAEVHVGNATEWKPASVIQRTGLVSYVVQLDGGTQKRCHVDQLRSRLEQSVQQEVGDNGTAAEAMSEDSDDEEEDGIGVSPPNPQSEPQEPRYPRRERKPPDRFM